MRGGVGVRRARTEDLDAICEIEAAAFSRPWCRDTFASILLRMEAELLVATDRDVVVGYTVLICATGEAELANLAVSPANRGQGVARALLAEATRTLEDRGVSHLYLAVRASNTGAINLYERFGFQGIGMHQSYYQDPAEDACILSLELSGSGDSSG